MFCGRFVEAKVTLLISLFGRRKIYKIKFKPLQRECRKYAQVMKHTTKHKFELQQEAHNCIFFIWWNFSEAQIAKFC